MDGGGGGFVTFYGQLGEHQFEDCDAPGHWIRL